MWPHLSNVQPVSAPPRREGLVRRILARLRAWLERREGRYVPEEAQRGAWHGSGGHERHRIGWRAEEYVVRRLWSMGYHVLERNVRVGCREIDIVAQEGDVVAVIEVKTRRGRAAGLPEEGVNEAKQRKLCALAQAYIEATGWEGYIRIDVVGVELDRSGRLLRVSYWREAVDCW